MSKSFWYFEVIENDQVGVTIEAGEIQGVLQPGIAYDFGLFVDLVKITTSAVAITVDDPELITIDKQRIGLEVTADVFRPREADIVISNYSRYRNIYLNDESLQQRMTAFTLQAMKVCVGDKKFDEAVIGSGRDDLRACIDDELSGLAEPLGLKCAMWLYRRLRSRLKCRLGWMPSSKAVWLLKKPSRMPRKRSRKPLPSRQLKKAAFGWIKPNCRKKPDSKPSCRISNVNNWKLNLP
ncbi:MAG: SPFH domain-containing protein [Anaerolineales bacterium]|nr:SPFH domain-containing protein [Anaerolineales bacterium]